MVSRCRASAARSRAPTLVSKRSSQLARRIVELLPVQDMLRFHRTVEARQVLFQLGNSLPDRAYFLGQRLCPAQCSP